MDTPNGPSRESVKHAYIYIRCYLLTAVMWLYCTTWEMRGQRCHLRMKMKKALKEHILGHALQFLEARRVNATMQPQLQSTECL